MSLSSNHGILVIFLSVERTLRCPFMCHGNPSPPTLFTICQCDFFQSRSHRTPPLLRKPAAAPTPLRILPIWRDLHAKLPIKLHDPLHIHLRHRSSLGFVLPPRSDLVEQSTSSRVWR